MKLLKDYIALEQKILKYFGYNEHYTYPMADHTRDFWGINENEDSIRIADTDRPLDWDSMDHEWTIAEPMEQPAGIWRGPEFTMLLIRDDGETFFGIFDNTKERQYIDA